MKQALGSEALELSFARGNAKEIAEELGIRLLMLKRLE